MLRLFLTVFLPVCHGFATGIPAEYYEACMQANVSETDVSDWIAENAKTNPWDRPLKNSRQPMSVLIGVAIANFAEIVRSLCLCF